MAKHGNLNNTDPILPTGLSGNNPDQRSPTDHQLAGQPVFQTESPRPFAADANVTLAPDGN